MPEQQRTRRSWWFKLGVALVTLIAAGALAFYLWGSSAHRRWDNYAAFLQANGEPLTHAEIEALRTVIPDDQNGARIIEALIEDLDAIGDDPQPGPVLVLGKPREDGPKGETHADFFRGVYRHTIEPSRDFMERHGDLLDKIREVRHFPGGRFTIEYDPDPFETLLPHTDATRTAAKFLSLDVALALIDGDRGRAADDITIIHQLADLFDEEPFLISRLAEISINAFGTAILEDTLRVGELPTSVLVDLQRQTANRLSSSSIRWALWGERAVFNEACENLIRGVPVSASVTSVSSNTAPPPGGLGWAPAIFVRMNQYAGIQLYASLLDAGDDPQALMTAASIRDAELDALSDIYLLVKTVTSKLELAVLLHIRCSAYQECARAALAAERFRLSFGHLPERPEDLVPGFLPSWPDDPFDGRPMRFKSTEEGILIYNIGPNLTDDGGLLDPPENHHRSPDDGFRLFKLDRRGVLIIDETPPAESGSIERSEE